MVSTETKIEAGSHRPAEPLKGGEIAPLSTMTDEPPITWRKTFPESEPGTDGVAEVEGRTIGRVYRMDYLPRERKPWFSGVSYPTLTGSHEQRRRSPVRRQARAKLCDLSRTTGAA